MTFTSLYELGLEFRDDATSILLTYLSLPNASSYPLIDTRLG